MAIVIDGSANTIAGLAVGGLPDGTVDTDTLASGLATQGITEFDQWRITSALSNSPGSAVITANWERSDNKFEKIGTGLTESSGIFSFPSTGKYLITFSFYANGNDDRYIGCEMHASNDSGSNYTQIADNLDSAYSGSGTYSAGTIQSLIDVTDASTFRLKFHAVSVGTVTFNAASDAQRTGFTCIRLGGT